MFFRSKKKSRTAPKENHTGNVMTFGRSTEREHHIFLDAKTILSRPKCEALMFQLKEAIGVNEKYFQEYYLPVINEVAIRMQSMPASEYNHHSYDFGLFEHTLEVAVYAIRSSYQYNYFPDGDEEKIQLLIPVYTYITFLSAMLHDAGKAFTDVQFKILVDGDWKIWSSLYKNIPSEAEEVQYKIERKKDTEGNCYNKNSHELYAPCLIVDLIPAKGLEWISEFSYKYSPRIFTHFIHAIASDNDNASYVGMNVVNGDKTSCEDYMANSNVSSIQKETFGELASLPIHDAYIKAIRTIVHDHKKYNIAINQRHNSKMSHIERYGDMVFLSSKFITELASKELSKQGISVPADKKVWQILADNKITYKTPSEDTLWWVDFNSNPNAAPRDLTYLAIDMKTLANPQIDDLSKSSVFIRFAPKTTNRVAHGELPNETDYEQSLYDIVYSNKKPVNDNPEYGMQEDKPTTVKLDNQDKEATLENLLPEAKPAHKPQPLDSLLGGLSSKNPEQQNKPAQKAKQNKPAQKATQNKQQTKKTEPGKPTDNDKRTNKKPNTPENRTEQQSVKEKTVGKVETPNSAPPSTDRDKVDNDLDMLMPSAESKNEQDQVTDAGKASATPAQEVTSSKKGTTDSSSLKPKETQTQEAPFSQRKGDIPASFESGVGRKNHKERADQECLNSLFPFIQQQIDAGSISFNRKDSPIHRVAEGILIVSPQYFEQFEKSLSKKHRTTIKRSSFCVYNNDTSITTYTAETEDESKSQAGKNKINGFLITYTDFTFNGKALPINRKLTISQTL